MKNLRQVLDWSKIDHSILANALWPDSTPSAAYQNLRKLITGKTKTFTVEQVKTICLMTGCEVNELLGV